MESVVISELADLLEIHQSDIFPDSPLIGDSRLLDSMKLVELCLRLEDRASELGFDFDWTSDEAMSRSRSMFRTIETLENEFNRQRESS